MPERREPDKPRLLMPEARWNRSSEDGARGYTDKSWEAMRDEPEALSKDDYERHVLGRRQTAAEQQAAVEAARLEQARRLLTMTHPEQIESPTVARLIEQLMEERQRYDVVLIERDKAYGRLRRTQEALTKVWEALDELVRTGEVDRDVGRAVFEAMVVVEACARGLPLARVLRGDVVGRSQEAKP